MDTCDINDLSESIKSIAFDGSHESRVMINFNPSFNPVVTPDYESCIIDILIDNVYGLYSVDNTGKSQPLNEYYEFYEYVMADDYEPGRINLMMNNCEIEMNTYMDWDDNFRFTSIGFYFRFIRREVIDKQPTIYKNRWFENE